MSQSKFWEEMGDIGAAMLAIGKARHVPMSPYPDEESKSIWFITAQGTDLVEAIETGNRDASLIVTGNGDLHARIDGTASISRDLDKLEELWNPIASSWFESIEDPDIRLIEMKPSEAEVWATKGSLGFAIQIAKSKITGEHPDMGEHFRVRF